MSMPDAFVILFALLLLGWLASYIIPSGQFATNENGTVIPGSYEVVASPNLGIMDLFLAIQEGMIKSANLIFLVLIMGGAIAVIEQPGTINSGIRVLVDKTKNNKYLLIDRKSTRLNSSHVSISYAVFCLKKKK